MAWISLCVASLLLGSIHGCEQQNDLGGDLCEELCGVSSGSGEEPECCPTNVVGPHSLDCLRNWWIDAGCDQEGTSSPDNMDVSWWQERTGAAIQEDMSHYALYASQGQGEYYARCHGTLNPESCVDDGAAPHSMACLIAWWKEAGCSLDGDHSPIYKPHLYWWQKRSSFDVQRDMALYFQYAEDSYLGYQQKCYGDMLEK